MARFRDARMCALVLISCCLTSLSHTASSMSRNGISHSSAIKLRLTPAFFAALDLGVH